MACALVERLAIGLWRQRRAVKAESASLHLQRLALAEPGSESSAVVSLGDLLAARDEDRPPHLSLPVRR